MRKSLSSVALIILTMGATVLGVALYLRARDRRIEQGAVDKKEVSALDSARGVQGDTLRARDIVRYHDVTRYHDVAESIIRDNPTNIPAREIKTVADRAISSDSARRAADSVVRATQAYEIARLQAMKSMRPPRISLYGAGGYDFIQKEPTSKLGTEIRILEPLYINGYLEARTRMERDSLGARNPQVRFSGVVEARIVFR